MEHPIFSINLLKCFLSVKKRSRKLEISIKPDGKLEIYKLASISNCWIHLSGKNQVHQMSEHGAKLLGSPYLPFAFWQRFSIILGFRSGWDESECVQWDVYISKALVLFLSLPHLHYLLQTGYFEEYIIFPGWGQRLGSICLILA